MVFFAQEKDPNLPQANAEFTAKKFNEAEAKYRISASKFKEKSTATYNLGNAIYNQKQAAEAKVFYAKAIKVSKTFPEKHNAFHNLGNTFMLEKNYEAAVDAYKNALINNPNDEETRYNYALAKKKKKENPDKNKDKDKDKDKDKKPDPKDQDQKPDNKDKPKAAPSAASQEQMKNLLEAMNNEEKRVQQKVNQGKQKGKPVQTDKDW